MPILKVKKNGVWEVIGNTNANTLDGNPASYFAVASDVEELQRKVGETDVSTQIADAMEILNGEVDTINTRVDEFETDYVDFKERSLAGFNETGVAFNDIVFPHITNSNNPHDVTKEQVGLGDVDNTADMDKPVSTLMQAALDEKAELEHIHTQYADVEHTHEVSSLNCTTSDNGKFLRVENGAAAWVTVNSAEGVSF